MIYKSIASMVVVLCLAMLLTTPQPAAADTLIGSPFITSWDGWTDTFDYGTPPTDYGWPGWGILLESDASNAGNTLIECSNGGAGNGMGSDGKYTPYMLINSNTTPSDYTLDATLATYDNDGFGIVFGYQDNDNYFRLGFRSEGGGYGFAGGVSMQKVVAGEITQIEIDSGVPFSLSTETAPVPFDVSVQVTGTSYTVVVNNDPFPTFNDSDADLQPGKYGVMSWRQMYTLESERELRPNLGTMVQQMQVTSSTVNATHTFTGAWPVSFKNVAMTRSDTVQDLIRTPLTEGSFLLDFRNGTIIEHSDAFQWAVDNYPTFFATDFIGPTIIVDEPGSQDLENYEVQVRMSDSDDEGLGVLVRVKEDPSHPGQFSFYRIFFGYDNLWDARRPPTGMSIQKCVPGPLGPTWETIFYEDPEQPPLFRYTPRLEDYDEVPFDVKVRVVNNDDDTATTIYVEVIDDPQGDPTLYVYDPVVDDDNPLLTGSVGLFSWGNAFEYVPRTGGFGAVFGGYGGDPGAPLVVSVATIPEIPGDANRDGYVNEADAQAMADNWGDPGGWEQGNFDDDGIVGPKDAAILAANWGYDYWTVEGGTAAVPEPGAIVLLLGALAAMAVVRRRG